MPETSDGTRPPRRSDPTRARILDAAKRRFAREGYEATTIRSVAADAAIDPSMVMRYYGSKDGLFVAAANIDLELPDLARAPRDEWGERLVRHFFARWEGRAGEDTLALLLRSAATIPHAAERLRAVAAGQLANTLQSVGVDEPQRRAALVASQMVGLAFCRYVLVAAPLAAAAPEQLVGDLGPTVQRYITGSLAG